MAQDQQQQSSPGRMIPGTRMISRPQRVSHMRQRHNPRKQKTPQQKVDDFWEKFTTATPGKATTVIPLNKHAGGAAASVSGTCAGGAGVASATASTTTTTTTAQASYEEAAALCRAKVAKIVRECRRVNQKYRDPHFDLDLDLKTNRRDCLEALSNFEEDYDVGDIYDDVGSRGGSRRRWRSVGRTEEGGRDGRVPREKDANAPFLPRSVKRVGEIFDEPRFYIDGPTAHDVRQGRDGDCWLMAALCTLSNKPGLIERICVARDEAVGVYGFVFHRDGEWFSEIIDDKLYLTKPDYDDVHMVRILWEDRDRINSEETYRKTYQSNSGALYFASCDNPNETWLPLLEKAYAKAHGDYASIEGGFTGEGIEDLTGGVTSELFATDILDKEYFWKEELMKVNEQFLFGCSTGVWGRGWGERKGIYEMHAYSVMRAVDLDGERLVCLKNPWGKGEWKGAWSDGSKEWTPEWLKKLDHRFGDDGAFWISYEDLLRKYQAFDRTRLFGPDWKITSVWTTLSVPWTLGYHDTKFAFTLARPGPAVLILSQLDDRYFRGLEGQYRFKLSFRLHRVGEEDYVVRSQTTYRMNRSVNVELDLEAGEYFALIKIDATRDESVMPVEDVLRANAKIRREKLIRIGLAYDLAHSKCKVVETPEEQKAREASKQREKEKEIKEEKARLMRIREKDYYFRVKRLERQKKKTEKNKAKELEKEKERKGRDEANEQLARTGPPPRLPRRRSLPKNYSSNVVTARGKALGVGPEMTTPNSPPGTTNSPAETAGEERAGMGLPDSGDLQEGSRDSHSDIEGNDGGQEESAGVLREENERPAKHGLSNTNNTGLNQDTPSASSHEHPPGEVADEQQGLENAEGGSASMTASPITSGAEDLSEDNLPPPDLGGYGPPPQPHPLRGHGTRPRPPRFQPRGDLPVRDWGPQNLQSEDGFSSVSSLSDISDREVEFLIEETNHPPVSPHSRPFPQPGSPIDSEDESEGDPWNAVAVIGFRVCYKTSGEDNDEEVVRLRVLQPSRYSSAEEDEKEPLEKGADTALVLDLDDSAKDATLEEPDKKNIADGEDVEGASESFRTACSF